MAVGQETNSGVVFIFPDIVDFLDNIFAVVGLLTNDHIVCVTYLMAVGHEINSGGRICSISFFCFKLPVKGFFYNLVYSSFPPLLLHKFFR